MKNLNRFWQFILLAVIAISCTVTDEGPPGPRGPQGPPGFDGQDGDEFVAIAYEFGPISFSADNEYGTFLLFDDEDLPNIYESDKALTYLLDLDAEQNDGLDVWSPLPQTRFNEVGTYVYNYNFTREDVYVYMDANFSLNLLNGAETDNKFFRVIIIPAESTQRTSDSVDYDDYNAVMKHYGLTESDVKKASK